MRKSILAATLALILGLAAAGQALAAATLKLNHGVLPTHAYHIGALRFAELVKEKTNGEVLIEVLHSAQLGAERESIEALQLGTLDLTIVSTAPLGGFTKSFMAFDLPFIFQDRETAYKVLDGDIGQKALAEIEKNSIIGLSYYENGFRHVTNSKQPIALPEDMRGMKIRTMENKIHMASFRTIGSSPTPMAFGEVFTALQQRTVDGQENPMALISDMKFYEVQQYISMTGHFYAAAPLLMSKFAFDNLTPEQRKAIHEAAVESTDYQRSLMREQDEQAREILRKNGMQFLEVDKAPWLKAMEPVYKEFGAEIGQELIDAILAAGK